MLTFAVVLFTIVLFAGVAEAACSGSSPTFTAASPALANIQACVALAAGSDTINVPAGSVNWGGGTLSLTKGVQIIGAGIGNTVITNGSISYIPASANWAANYYFRLSGFSLLGAGNAGNACNVVVGCAPILLDCGCATTLQTNIRVDHNRISNWSDKGLLNYGSRGVIDHNTFDSTLYVMRVGWGDHGLCGGHSGDGYGAGQWQWSQFGPFVYGNINTALYLEDNVIDNTGSGLIVTDGDEGGSYVFRYNTITGNNNGQWYDLHAHPGDGGDWPTRGGEIYGNSMPQAGNALKEQGAGRTLVFFNTGFTNTSNIQNTGIRYYQGDGCIQDSTWGDGLTGIKMQVNNSYAWGNRSTATGPLGNALILADGSSQQGVQICNGRQSEKFNESVWIDNTSWTPGQALTTGMAMGTLANRPTTCTPGTAYWATNQSTTNLTGMGGAAPSTPISGTLYQCSNVAYGPHGYDPTAGTANTWVTLFTPAPYPHPLTSGGGGDVMPPAAPANLRVQ